MTTEMSDHGQENKRLNRARGTALARGSSPSNCSAFLMDGTEHTTGCCDAFGKPCKCGGWMHYQPVYGGYFYECERCRDTDSA